jgi:predicted RND superfamily exporter protein|tara:strand:- start:3082 stop:5412 length:2331 start_codon:yes stop_codon:yes gene_type:complete
MSHSNKLVLFFEKLIFSNRILILTSLILLCAVLTFQGTQVKPEASFLKMLPTNHEFIKNFLSYKKELSNLGNVVRVVVENKNGDIFDADYQEVLKNVTDEVFFISGVNRDGLKSLWTPNVRWQEVTEEGFIGGSIIPDGYNGSKKNLDIIKSNILKSGQVGNLVSNDFKSSIILAPLQDTNPETGLPLDYHQFSKALEDNVRAKYTSENINIRIVGFAKVVGDLIDGAMQVVLFFMLAVLIVLLLLWFYSRCLRSTFAVVICSILAVFAQLGTLNIMGYGINPYSMLVPFLVFAIGVSHGVQIVNSIIHHAETGANKLDAAKLAFRSLYLAGITALISDAIGFTTLMVIDIGVIQELAIAASVGVAIIIITNLVALPIILSFIGISPKAVEYSRKNTHNISLVEKLFANFTKAPLAILTIVVSVGLFSGGLYYSQFMKIGDLDAGAPELRPDSRYNLDNAFIVENYTASTDVFVIMAETGADQCSKYNNLVLIDQLQWQLKNTAGVQDVISITDISKLGMFGMNEGSLKWVNLNRNEFVVNATLSQVPSGFINADCSMAPIIVFLNDHKADTLNTVVNTVTDFSKQYPQDGIKFLLAAGNAGVEASTNIVIEEAQSEMLIWVYSVVIIICLITFRSVPVVVCIIVPLIVTSVLSQALMAFLGIGVKVATLPVIALGVGIGVDYGIYIFSKIKEGLAMKKSLYMSYLYTLNQTGKAVGFTGVTLAICVATWAFSPIKFQSDMGLLLTFMFVFNMIGALTLIPSLAWLLRIGKSQSES